MAKVKKMAFGGMGNQPANALRPMTGGMNQAPNTQAANMAQAAAQRANMSPASKAVNDANLAKQQSIVQAAQLQTKGDLSTSKMSRGTPPAVNPQKINDMLNASQASRAVKPPAPGGIPSFATDYAKNALAQAQQARQAAPAPMAQARTAVPNTQMAAQNAQKALAAKPTPAPMAQSRTAGPSTQMAAQNAQKALAAKPMTGGMGQAPRMMKAGGKVSASSRADGIATKGKTRGRMV